MKTPYIEPGSAWENAYSETFNSQFGDELLNREIFTNLVEAKVLVEECRGKYSNDRPNSLLGCLTPAEFARGHELGTLASATVGGLVTEEAGLRGQHTADIPTLS